MKFLTLIRHASAVHDSAYKDFDRPLRNKGLKKTELIAEVLDEKGYCPDFRISSSAARAYETAEIYSAKSKHDLPVEDIAIDKRLYLPSPGDILECLREIDDAYSDVFLFSHNNGISWAAQQLCNDSGIIMPTGSAVRIEFELDSWHDLLFGTGRKLDFVP